ncbi:hypothetical protein L2E82_42222 [Cichorium intybus]|uniref:Uncharacterized protein n=1 Tax=Cichorium intybus TaxID=13427 RepID=A0ACB8ZMM2_CICIN|nr:hypothetical protein L2E82_42222 [Cichorium intybus]
MVLQFHLPNTLIILYLNNNSFSGQIPVKYSQLNHLQELDHSFNSLSGVSPPSLFSLPSISYLNLTSNKLSSSAVPLQRGSKLANVDISQNRFTGSLPSCLTNESKNKIVKYDDNRLMIDVTRRHPASYCVEEARGVEVEPKDFKDSGLKRNSVVFIGVIMGSMMLLVLLVLGFVVLSRKL